MSKADVMMEEDLPQLYIAHVTKEDGTDEITGYAYGLPWVAMALMMDDIKFDTPEEAKEWWDRRYGSN